MTERILWWRSDFGVQYLPEICSAGKFTHLMISVPGAYDKGQWKTYGQIVINEKRKTVPLLVAEYIDIATWACRQSGVVPIYCGRLWPAWDAIPLEWIYDEKYYCTVIANLRYRYPEAMIALDTEPMGDSVPGRNIKSGTMDAKIEEVIAKTIELVGQVDYILPAGSSGDKDYEILARLGRTRISEGTYYIDSPPLSDFSYPAEMPGYAITGSSKTEAEKRYFSPAEAKEKVGDGSAFFYMNRNSVPFLVRELDQL